MMGYTREQVRKDIRFGVCAIVAACIILAVGKCAYGAECLPSARAVWDAHPGSHATWNMVDDQKCWRVGHGKRHSGNRVASKTIPLPRAAPWPHLPYEIEAAMLRRMMWRE